MSSPCTITSPSATYAGPGGLRLLVMIASKRALTSAGVPVRVVAQVAVDGLVEVEPGLDEPGEEVRRR